MSPVQITPEEREWGPLTRAAEVAGCTPYRIKTAVICNHIRVKRIEGFLPLYNLPDALSFGQAING
jgi:hypothetical protein